MDIKINLERLKNNLTELSEIGKDPNGGISRPSFSRADLEARDWLKNKIACAGLCVSQDGAGNIFGTLEGDGKTIMTGSHIDTVVNGGMFDGSIGVLSALECLQTIQEKGLPHKKPLSVASFTDEEGNLAGDFLGSRAFTGTLEREILEKGQTQFGRPFKSILKNTEFTIDSIMEAHTQRPQIGAFIEIHIEQGPVLETEDKSIGIVESIAGKQYWTCFFQGQASHAGTTPFELRHDAFLGLADLALKGTHYVAKEHYGSMLTIGSAHIYPGSFSIVPGRVDFSIDFRSQSSQTLKQIGDKTKEIAGNISNSRGLHFDYQVIDSTEPVKTSSRLNTMAKKHCEKLGYSHMMINSGAGHDAQILDLLTDISMIFIPCEDGISHSPQENIDWKDLENSANLQLNLLLDLSA
ncbi:MAG: hydantoinase/carbamoylase family amidase [Candidatus Aminicenantes bacterium]|nr:hydantoinase/carbamoylase family amidase [Candidatus Aminicenantes bacterium]